MPSLVLITLVMSGNGMVAPMLSLYALQFGVSGTLIGMMITLFGIGRMLANLPAGILSERFGRRLFLCIGPAILALGSVGAAVASDFGLLLLWRFVQGVGSGIYMTTALTVLVQLSRPGERGRVMALFQACLLLGGSIGPGIGGFLAAHFGYAAPFWAYAVVAAAAFAVALATFREPPPVETPASGRKGPTSLRGLLASLPFALLCLVTFGVFFTRTAAFWVLIPLTGNEKFGLPVDTIGLALTVAAVANLLMLPVVGPTIDRIGANTVTIVATIATGVALVLMAISTSPFFFWTCLVFLGIAGGFNGPSVTAATANLVPPGLYGPAMGAQRAIGDAGFVIGPILVGLLYDFTSLGHPGGLVFNGLLMIVAGAVVILGARRSATE